MVRLKFLLIFVVALILGSCSENQMDTTLDDVSNLEVSVDVSNDNSGMVVITVSADNTTEFHFYVNDGFTQDPSISQNGTHTHIYASTGTCRISNER